MPASQYVVQKLDDLQQVIRFFDEQTFYTTKGDSFRIWREIVQMVARKVHLTKVGFTKISEMREKMNLISNKEKRLRGSQMLIEKVANIARKEIEK